MIAYVIKDATDSSYYIQGEPWTFEAYNADRFVEVEDALDVIDDLKKENEYLDLHVRTVRI